MNSIFLKEKLDFKLTIYEILSLNSDSGIIEKVQNSVTLDSFKKNLLKNFPEIKSLKEFYKHYFNKKYKIA